jgi:hypothetical protein
MDYTNLFKSFLSDKEYFLLRRDISINTPIQTSFQDYIWLCQQYDLFLNEYFSPFAKAKSTEPIKYDQVNLFQKKIADLIHDQYYILKTETETKENNFEELLFISLLSGFKKHQNDICYNSLMILENNGNDYQKTIDHLERHFNNLIINTDQWPITSPPNTNFMKIHWINANELHSRLNRLFSKLLAYGHLK